jgi:hypothetical protein
VDGAVVAVGVEALAVEAGIVVAAGVDGDEVGIGGGLDFVATTTKHNVLELR